VSIWFSMKIWLLTSWFLDSFADRVKVFLYSYLALRQHTHRRHIQDTLKVSGIQVSPVEIENVLLANPKRLIIDATVAGVRGGRTSDEKVPRAWIVLSDVGEAVGADAVKRELDAWHRENLSKYKWLRGGIEVVKQVR
jgi:acyl-coenzyme A synthetase/AMP-(fatty) acid ligase